MFAIGLLIDRINQQHFDAQPLNLRATAPTRIGCNRGEDPSAAWYWCRATIGRPSASDPAAVPDAMCAPLARVETRGLPTRRPAQRGPALARSRSWPHLFGQLGRIGIQGAAAFASHSQPDHAGRQRVGSRDALDSDLSDSAAVFARPGADVCRR